MYVLCILNYYCKRLLFFEVSVIVFYFIELSFIYSIVFSRTLKSIEINTVFFIKIC